MMDRVPDVGFSHFFQLVGVNANFDFSQEEIENGNPAEDDQKQLDSDDYSSSDSRESEVQYGARRKKPEKVVPRSSK